MVLGSHGFLARCGFSNAPRRTTGSWKRTVTDTAVCCVGSQQEEGEGGEHLPEHHGGDPI